MFSNQWPSKVDKIIKRKLIPAKATIFERINDPDVK
jgi:hypothetical protein